MSNFVSATNGELQDIYLNWNEFEKIDNFVGNRLWMMGMNPDGQMGNNGPVNVSRSSPIQTVSGGTNWRQILVTEQFTLGALKTDGTLWTWGRNQYGQLGTNDRINRSSPVQVVGNATNWKQISSTGEGISAIKTDGTLWLWGRNNNAQLGDNTIITRSSPVQIFGGGTNWRQTGGRMAIKTDGTLWTWGNNSRGELGDNTTIARSSPVQVFGGGTNWKQAVMGGASFNGVDGCAAAIKTDGTLWTWGRNETGQLGLNDRTPRSSPVQILGGGTNWRSISGASWHLSAIKTDGTLWLWGRNQYGQLGTNDIVHRSSPVQVLGGGTNWKSVPPVTLANCTGALKTDGTLWFWGFNSYGGFGANDRIHRSSPVQTVVRGNNWKEVCVGNVCGAITFMD